MEGEREMSDPKHTHYSPYEPPRQVPGTLLDCTPEFASYHQVDGSELWADYAYHPRFGPVSDTGLPAPLLDALTRAYLHRRSADMQWRIADVVADEEYVFRVSITNRTRYAPDESGPTWHTEEWGLHADGQWHGIPANPHPPHPHDVAFCSNCGY